MPSGSELHLRKQRGSAIGKIVYTQWLNERGGIEADLTVTRLSHDEFLIVSTPATQMRDLSWLRANIPSDAHAMVTDMTSAYSVLGLWARILGALGRSQW